jgi:hypothetical protein
VKQRAWPEGNGAQFVRFLRIDLFFFDPWPICISATCMQTQHRPFPRMQSQNAMLDAHIEFQKFVAYIHQSPHELVCRILIYEAQQIAL